MSHRQEPAPPLFSQVDVTAGSTPLSTARATMEQSAVLREVLAAQDRTNELLEELLTVTANSQKQKAQELYQWRNANPGLAESCREAAESLSRVQLDYLERITDEINDSAEDMVEGEFLLNEFVDRFGPRLAHLNGVIQVLAQLSSTPTPTSQQA